MSHQTHNSTSSKPEVDFNEDQRPEPTGAGADRGSISLTRRRVDDAAVLLPRADAAVLRARH